jgi:hypothetical protein
VKCEIGKHLGIGSMVTAHRHMERGAIKRGRRLLGGWKLRLFGETIMVVKFKVSPIIDMDGPFCNFEHRDIWNQVE